MDTWTTKDGVEMNIADMQTSHIKNCIAMVQRKIVSGDTIQIIGQASGPAEDCWADEVDMADSYKECISSLENELSKRGEL